MSARTAPRASRLAILSLCLALGLVAGPGPAAAQPAPQPRDTLATTNTLLVGCLAGTGALLVVSMLPALSGIPVPVPVGMPPATIAGPGTWAGAGCLLGLVSGLAAIGISLLLEDGAEAGTAATEDRLQPVRY